MRESKELNKYTSLIIVLSVLLAISLIAGATFAWFASSQDKSKAITLGDPVVVNIAQDRDGNLRPVGAEIPFTINGDHLLPGMKINPYAAVKFQASLTPAILRVKLSVTVEGGTASTDEISQLVSEINQQIATQGYGFSSGAANWMLDTDSGWWYYTGGEVNDFVTPKNSVLKSIDCSGAPLITFMDPAQDQVVYLPSYVDNKFATASVTFWFSVQAVQAILPSDSEEGDGFMINTIANAEHVFEEAFA